MLHPGYYASGTASVTQGQTAVTGQSTLWLLAGLQPGDMFVGADGVVAIIASIQSNTSLTLRRTWPGAAQSEDPYEIWRQSDGVRVSVQTRELLELLSSGELEAIAAAGSEADRISYWTGVGASALTPLTSVARTLLAQTTQDTLLTTGLGATALGSALFTAADAAAVRSEIGATALGAALFTAADAAAVRSALGVWEFITSNRTYYVRADGNDSNDGLTNTSGGAFATIQQAINVVASLIIPVGITVTCSVGAGTYTGANTLRPLTGGGTVVISGAGPTTIVNPTAATCFTATGVRGWTVQNMRLTTTTSGHGIVVFYGADITFGGIEFGALGGTSFHLYANGGTIRAASNYSVNGAASRHFHVENHGLIVPSSRTVTLSGTLNFGSGFAYASRLGLIVAHAMTFTGGTITGTRYVVSPGGQIFTNGGGPNYFPGNSPGTDALGWGYV